MTDTEEWIMPVILLLLLAIVVIVIVYSYSSTSWKDVSNISDQVFTGISANEYEDNKDKYDKQAKSNFDKIYGAYKKCSESKDNNCKCKIDYSEFRSDEYGYDIILSRKGTNNVLDLYDYQNKAVVEPKLLGDFNGYCFTDVNNGNLVPIWESQFGNVDGSAIHFRYAKGGAIEIVYSMGDTFENSNIINTNPLYIYKMGRMNSDICILDPNKLGSWFFSLGKDEELKFLESLKECS